jgi:hypothetical protein
MPVVTWKKTRGKKLQRKRPGPVSVKVKPKASRPCRTKHPTALT